MRRHPIGRSTFGGWSTFTSVSAVSAFIVISAIGPRARAAEAPRVEHVVVVIWDGLRPDSVNERDTPTLFKLAAEGTSFTNHHCVYPSSTEVNGATLSTGGYP